MFAKIVVGPLYARTGVKGLPVRTVKEVNFVRTVKKNVYVVTAPVPRFVSTTRKRNLAQNVVPKICVLIGKISFFVKIAKVNICASMVFVSTSARRAEDHPSVRMEGEKRDVWIAVEHQCVSMAVGNGRYYFTVEFEFYVITSSAPILRYCAACGGKSMCAHGRRKYRCKDCCTSAVLLDLQKGGHD